MLNNSQEYSSNQAKREAMLQQIILEQKQKIRDLEQSSKKQNTLPQFKQQLMECTNQLEESKNIITQLLQQKEQLTQELEEHKQQENIKLNKQIMEIQEQFNLRVKQLESEKQVLQEELQQCQPLSKALNNYTQEEKYIQQINALYEFITTWQKQNMSEVVYYKRALEVQQNSSEQMSQRCQDEKKELQQQLNQLIKLDEKIQEDILLKLQQVTDGLSKFSNEIQASQILFQGNYEQIEEKLNQQIESSKVIFMNKGITQVYSTNQSEQSIIQEDVSQIEYLKSENVQLKQAIEDMKVLNIHREKALKMEIERYRNKCDFFTQQAELREQQYREELQKVVKYIEQIEKNFNSRENFYKFDQEQLQILLDNFRIITQQIGNELKVRKGNEHIKECKDLLYKLTQKRQKPKPIKNLEKLENICKDLLKHPPQVKQNDEIKELILDVSRQILNSQEYRSQTTLLFEGLDQLEGLMTSPNKRVDSLLDQFYKELQELTKIREATFQQNEIFNEIKQSLQQTPKTNDVDKSDIEYVEKLRELEKEQYKQEIEIAVIRSEKLLESQELKIKHLEYQLRKQETYINQQLQSTQKQQTDQETLIKQQKQQIAKLQKLVNEIQQQRIMDRRELLKLIQDSEQKQIEQYNMMIKQIDIKSKTVIEIVNKKLGKLAKGKFKEKEEQIIYKSSDEHLKQLQQKDKERDEQFQSKLDELGHIIQELKSNIENLHKEKGSLIEQLDGMNKVLQTQKKLYYSFRQQ